MQAKQQVPAHSKILPAQIRRVDGLQKTAVLYQTFWLKLVKFGGSSDRLIVAFLRYSRLSHEVDKIVGVFVLLD